MDSGTFRFEWLSGIVMGTVYLNVIRREGMNAMLRKVLRRAGFLYLLTVGLTIAFALLNPYFHGSTMRSGAPS